MMDKINSKRLVDTFCSLVSIDSESFEEREMCDHLKKIFLELGLTVTEDNAAALLREQAIAYGRNPDKGAGNLYAYLPAYPDELADREPLLLIGHMDTVSPGKNKKAILHEDGRITSDGATILGSDDLGAVAEMIEMIRVLQEQKLPHPPIELVICAAEEPFCRGGYVFDASALKARSGYVFDLSGPIGGAALAAPAIIAFTITVSGKASHAGFSPETGIHALKIAASAISRIPNGHVTEETTLNFGTIRGGVQRNIVPDSVEIKGELRSMSNEQVKYWLSQIETVFAQEAALVSPDARTVLDYEVMFDAYRIDEQEAVAQNYLKAAAALGIPVSLQDTFGGSDANTLNMKGLRTMVIASAMNNCHGTDEYTSVEDLKAATAIMLELARA